MATLFDPRSIGTGTLPANKLVANSITAAQLAPNAVTQAALRLDNNSYLRARNAADDADVNIVKLNGSNVIEFASIPQASGTPSGANDLTNVAYIDARMQGLKPKETVRLATTTDVDLATGTLLVVDGVQTVAGDRILVWQQTASEENGIYIAATGAWTRATDADLASELTGAYTVVSLGTLYGQKGYVETAVISTLDTDPVTFVQFNAATAMIGGDMITVTGATISVDLHSTSGLESSNPGNVAGQLRVKTDATTTKINGSNQVEGLKTIEETITLDATAVNTNKYVDLANTAYGTSAAVNSVTLCLKGFPTQEKTVDYAVDLTGGSGGVTRIDWDTLGLDGFLIVGDKIIVNYTYL